MGLEELSRALFAKYKRFEKCFFRADKSKDIVTYINLKHQFRAMFAFSMVSMIHGIYMRLLHGFSLVLAPLLILSVLIGYRTQSYNIMRVFFMIVMLVIPPRYVSTSLVFTAPVAMGFSNFQTLVQTQSYKLMVLHLSMQSILFYFYGAETMMTKIKGMNAEEITESLKLAVNYAFVAGCVTLVNMRIYHSQFLSVLRKVNTLKDDLSKANNQLNSQNLKLQSNLEMKDIFIYTFSHELKNALNGLLGNLSLAYDTAKDERVLQFLSSAKVCGEVLKNFIHNILDSGKLENGNLEVSPERKDVMSLLQNVWSICGRIIQNKRLDGLLEIEKNVPRYLELDEQRMIQIILNLVSNAVKFTEKGYIRLRICWRSTSTSDAFQSLPEIEEKQLGRRSQVTYSEEDEAAHSGDMQEFPEIQEDSPAIKENNHLAVTEYQKKFILGSQFYSLSSGKWHWDDEEILSSRLLKDSRGILKIQVVDSGCGMTPEQQGQLFQKFSQVGLTQGQRKIGTGLGLWICKELANRLDGDIKTRSTVGVGSVFEFTIQAKVSKIPGKSCSLLHPKEQSTSNYLPRKLSLGHRSLNALKTLIVDDDNFNIELMKNYLTKFGISYICAYDGEEAVSLFKTHYREICFVITDNFMPKKTGVEAAMEIVSFLEEKKRPKIPILCISGDLNVHGEGNGINYVIQKPINFDRLKEVMRGIYPQIFDSMNK